MSCGEGEDRDGGRGGGDAGPLAATDAGATLGAVAPCPALALAGVHRQGRGGRDVCVLIKDGGH